MKLRGVEFGNVINASGARNFFGEGYWFHKWLKPLGLDFSGATFVSKTTTLEPRVGNMPLRKDCVTPGVLKPECIKVYPLKGAVLNAVGLSGPGAAILFERGLWQKRSRPFFISFATISRGKQERLVEMREFVRLFRRHLPQFNSPVGLKINFSCPNTNVELDEHFRQERQFLEEVGEVLDIADELGVPLVLKFNAALRVEAACEIARLAPCDAVCVSNSIPWGWLSDEIDWQKLFGSLTSPLARFGGGALSGSPIFPVVLNWHERAQAADFPKPRIGGGGVLSKQDIELLKSAGVECVSVGTAALVRPWRVKQLVRYTNSRKIQAKE